MPMTDAQRRAFKNYRKKVKTKGVSFYPTQEDTKLYQWAESQGAFATYVKRLIREDMERHKD